ncbi:MAG: hypothetical protein ACKVUT_07370 [Gaiella sp.]
MTAAQLERTDGRVSGDVLHWRFETLARAGYEPTHAMTVATHVEIDLHAAVELVLRGCPPDTAMRILL